MKVRDVIKLMPEWSYVVICDHDGQAIIQDYMEYLKDSCGAGALDDETVIKIEAVHFTYVMKSGIYIYINTAIPF